MVKDSLHHEEEPIVALSSGQAPSAIAILRISGKNCHQKLLSCLKRKHSSSDWKMNVQSLCDFVDPKNIEILDEVMAVLFKSPHSYTGQDSAEIYFHGSPYIIQRAFEIFYSLGFRHAEPGEFTRRAYLSGKIDLSEAEGIHGLISSSSHQQWLAARYLYTGTLKKLVDTLNAQLLESIAWLEASIDFPEEDDTSHIQRDQILLRVQKVYESLKNLLLTYSNGKVASHGLSVAFFGQPNVGKSTLMNTLLNTERAIVTDIPGTTRDYLEESCLIEGRLVRLIDTAGVRKGAEKIEQMGIDRSFEISKNSDLVLFLAESPLTEKANTLVQKWIEEIKPKNYLKVLTKFDLEHSSLLNSDWMTISCHSGHGIQELRTTLKNFSDKFLEPLQDQTFITSVRHKDAVENALKTLDNFFKAVQNNEYDEILAFELHQTAKELRSIVGELNKEDVLDIVFSSFCVGK